MQDSADHVGLAFDHPAEELDGCPACVDVPHKGIDLPVGCVASPASSHAVCYILGKRDSLFCGFIPDFFDDADRKGKCDNLL